MRKLKEKTIPISKDDFICYSLMLVVGLSITWGVLMISQSIEITEKNKPEIILISSFAFVGFILGSIIGSIWWTDKWDLNPVHAIGYCLRWKD